MSKPVDPDDIPDDTSTAGAVGWLAEGLVRDWVRDGVVLFGLITFVAVASLDRMTFVVAGILVGLTGTVLPFVIMARRWVRSTQWLTLLALFAAEVAVMWLAWG